MNEWSSERIVDYTKIAALIEEQNDEFLKNIKDLLDKLPEESKKKYGFMPHDDIAEGFRSLRNHVTDEFGKQSIHMAQLNEKISK